jgi:hypothetical protein
MKKVIGSFLSLSLLGIFTCYILRVQKLISRIMYQEDADISVQCPKCMMSFDCLSNLGINVILKQASFFRFVSYVGCCDGYVNLIPGSPKLKPIMITRQTQLSLLPLSYVNYYLFLADITVSKCVGYH